MKKTRRNAAEDLGIIAPKKMAAAPLSVRLSDDDMRKLGVLAKRLEIGPSTMARLIVEKFIKQHDPEG